MNRLMLASSAALVACAIAGAVAATTAVKRATQPASEPVVLSEKDLLSAIKKDPAWNPACAQVGAIQVGQSNRAGALQNFCVNLNGDLLACYGGKFYYTQVAPGSRTPRRVEATEPTEVRVFSPAGQLKANWKVPMQPQAICVAADGSVYVGGEGKLAKLDQTGRVLLTVDSPALAGAKVPPKGATGDKAVYRTAVTGLAATGSDVFMAAAAPNEYTYLVYRLNQDLSQPKRVISKLSGCCGQMDIAAGGGGKLLVAHNARHRVETYDRDGKLLTGFGKKNDKAADCFGGCCEPKNLRATVGGEILAAESGPPTTIKRFTRDGKFLGVIALPPNDNGCVRATVDVSPDGKTFYLLDTGTDAIQVFQPKAAKPSPRT